MEKTEVTFEVFEDLEEIKRKLVKNGFNLTETYTLSDYYFSKHPMSRLKRMTYRAIMKDSFLVREIKEGKTKYILEYKAKRIDKAGNVKSEEKVEAVLSGLDCLKVFERSGLTMWCKVVNHSYVFKGSEVEFAVQVVDGLGNFIEIEEQEGMEGLTAEEKLSALIRLAKGLGLKIGDDFSCKKVFMLFKMTN